MTPLKPKNEKQKKVGKFKTSFSVSAVSLTPLKPIFATFEAIILANKLDWQKKVGKFKTSFLVFLQLSKRIISANTKPYAKQF
jgi:hypothetical protein